MTIHIKGDERVLFAGKTGSGKTFAANTFLEQLPRICVYDPHARLDYEFTTLEQANKLWNDEEFCVSFTEADDFSEFVLTHFDEGGFVCYIDEIYAICPPRSAVPPVITKLWTQGRANNIGAWCAFQRPTFVPLFVISEAEHFFCFRLSLEDDRKRMAQVMGPTVLKTFKDSYGFYYHDIRTDVVTFYPRLRVRASDVSIKEGSK